MPKIQNPYIYSGLLGLDSVIGRYLEIVGTRCKGPTLGKNLRYMILRLELGGTWYCSCLIWEAYDTKAMETIPVIVV